MSINLEKGLKRLWWAFAAVWWIAGIAFFVFLFTEGEFHKNILRNADDAAKVSAMFDDAFGDPAKMEELGAYYVQETEWFYIIGYFLIVACFPLVVKGLGKFGVWIIEGFKEDKPPIIEDKDSTEDKGN